MNPTEQYQEILKTDLVDETTFIEGKPYRVVHKSIAERTTKDGKPYSYTVIGAEPL